VVPVAPTPTLTPRPAPSPTPVDQRYAFLLLGYGGGGHDGAYLTDSMMVVIVDPTKKTLTMLSLPRDSWVPMSFDGKSQIYNKVNTAYAFAMDSSLYSNRLDRYKGNQGPGTFAAETVSQLLGIPIRYYVGLDFEGFRQMIDAVGGIDVDVPDSFSASYPINDDPSINPGWTVVRFAKGREHMNGERAIEFARAREAIDNPSEGSDFARSRRQRIIIQAFKASLFAPDGLIHLPQLLGIGSKHVDTNYGFPDLAQLSQLVLDWKDVTFYQTALTTANYLEDATGPEGTYIAVPNSPDHSWGQIRAFARRLWNDPPAGVAMPSTVVRVTNNSGRPDLANRVTAALLGMGYNVGQPVSGPRQLQTRLIDRTDGSASDVTRQIGQDLGLGELSVAKGAVTDGNVLELDLGADAANLSVSIPADTSAPASVVGVQRFGVWQ
jgi:LCP family protein required for cell wall assembly